MRICLYTTTALPKIGGQEIAVDALARQYQAQGHEVVVLAPHPRRPIRARDAELPYRVVRHPRLYSTRFLVDWYSWWLLRLNRKFAFDVVHCQGVYPHGYLATACRSRLGVPVVVTSQGDDVFSDNHRLKRPVLSKRIHQAVERADHLVAISSFTYEGYLQLGADPEQITLIPNGVDGDRLGQPAARPADLPASVKPGQYLLFLGRLVPRKGADVLLSALSGTAGKGGVDLVIAGAGAERAALEAMAHNLGLAQRVCFVGAVQGDKKTYLLQNARCMVVPSRTWEAQGIVVLEAFAAGVPVVASDLKGLADLIEPGRTGWLVPPEDSRTLANTLATALANPIREKMRARVRAVADGYSWPVVARRHIELFEKLLGIRRPWSAPTEREPVRRAKIRS